MKASRTIYTAIAAVALLTVGIAGAQCPCAGTGAGMGAGMGPGAGMGFGPHQPPMERALGMGGIHGRWWNNPNMIDQLKLTDDQRKAMDSIFLAHREKLVDLRGNLEKAELDLQPLMSQDQPNASAILGQVDKVAAARTELERANARFLLDIRAKLTPEQWKTVRDNWAQNRGWGGQGRGMRFRGGPPANPPQPPAAPAPPSN
ncbi:MAG: Spy/CpxP family protein refolding chaperone [Terracidiphilus sp.]